MPHAFTCMQYRMKPQGVFICMKLEGVSVRICFGVNDAGIFAKIQALECACVGLVYTHTCIYMYMHTHAHMYIQYDVHAYSRTHVYLI